MAYNGSYLSCLGNMGGLSDAKLWFYTTADSAATIAGTGYITAAAAKGIEVGDVVIVRQVTTLPNTTPLGLALYVVTAIASDAATVVKTSTA